MSDPMEIIREEYEEAEYELESAVRAGTQEQQKYWLGRKMGLRTVMERILEERE